MSKLSEYVKLIPNGIKNLSHIVEGITNQAKIELGIIPEHDLDVIIARRVICALCPYNSKNATKAGIYKSSRDDEHCIHCGCPILIRTASLEKDCGIEEYNKLNITKPIPLKWEKVKSEKDAS